MTQPELADALEHESGLLGLAGTADMRQVVERAGAEDPGAVLALEVYLHRLRAGIAAMAAAMGGLEVLVFTGGVGEHAAAVRSGAVDGLGFLGLAIDPAANRAPDEDRHIGDQRGPARTLVVRAREDREMARQTRDLLTESQR